MYVQVETWLKIFSNIIDPLAYDSQTMKAKAALMHHMNALTAGMCKSYAIAEKRGVAQSDIATIITQHKGTYRYLLLYCANIDLTWIKGAG